MALTFTEIAGERPVDEWLAAQIREFVRRTYGMEIEVRYPGLQRHGIAVEERCPGLEKHGETEGDG